MSENPIAAITAAVQIKDESERAQILATITNNLPSDLLVCRDTLALLAYARGDTSYPEARLTLTSYENR